MNYLLGALPRHCAYASNIPPGNPRFNMEPDVDLWAKVRNDPSFGYMFVRSFLDARQCMPNYIHEDQFWRLFEFKRYRDVLNDFNVREACALTHPKQSVARTIIECLLLHPGIKYKYIAFATGYSEDVIDLFHELLFNVRNRTYASTDEGFILSLVYPESRQVEFTHNYHLRENWVHIARRISYNHGVRPMLQWMGGLPSDSEIAGVESMRAIESRIASSGRFAMNCGFQHQPGAIAISGARQLLQSSKIGGQDHQDDDLNMGLSRLSMDQAAQHVLKGLMMSEAADRLKAARVYDVSIADEIRKLALQQAKDKAL